jgi:hypothetical protein
MDDHRALAGFDGRTVNFDVDQIILRIRCHVLMRAA